MMRSGGFPVMFGAAMDLGASRRGSAAGPLALRHAGLLRALGAGARDAGDLPCPTPLEGFDAIRPAHHLGEIAAWARAVQAQAEAVLAEGGLPVLLGGDHSLPLGSVAASARHAAALGRPLFVLWIDAHGDFNTPATSPSGNVHGMTLAALCGEPGLGPVWGNAPPPPVDPTRVHVLGARDLDAEEAALLAARGVGVTTAAALRQGGVAAALRPFLARLAAEDGVLHVSFDVDSLDPVLAPGVGTPVPGGLSAEEAAEALAMLRDSGRMAALDIVELNPFLDREERSARLTVALMAELFGAPNDARRAA
ncbi:arginase [Pseudoroseomonas cervicalis]|uniref:arginase n=1 Tax=Teichococcus cervicalis TaxID=204525 RepID=UPI00277FE045|nr:arginase [Pseudoroseomonas cervicalis]MDQ1079850.1 arginase [Pseudoroseomonas cervicalis]